MKYYKTIGIIIAVILLMGIVLYHIPVRYKINKVLSGAECRLGDITYIKNRSITVNGIYYQYLFQKDTFKGTIKIEGYDFTSKDRMIPLSFYDGKSGLTYIKVENGIPIQNTLGFISCTPDFDRLYIGVSEPIDAESKSWSNNNGLFISAKAGNRNEAVGIAKELSKKGKWMSNIKWN